MIEIQELGKSYGDRLAVDSVSLCVGEGEIFGLLGPNGAGKTTTIHMVSGILPPDRGRVRISGHDVWRQPRSAKRLLGVVPQQIALFEDLTARDHLDLWASLYGIRGGSRRRVDDSLALVGLANRSGQRVRTFSGGMKRRLNLCLGLLHRPRYLLLDEPTVGIDPQARWSLLEVIRQVAREGTGVLYTSHYLEEAQELCHRLAILDHGRILTQGTLEELTRRAGEGPTILLKGHFEPAQLHRELSALEGIRIHSIGQDQAVLVSLAGGSSLGSLVPKILESVPAVEDLSIQQPSLSSAFLRLTGREMRD